MSDEHKPTVNHSCQDEGACRTVTFEGELRQGLELAAVRLRGQTENAQNEVRLLPDGRELPERGKVTITVKVETDAAPPAAG